MKKNNTIAISLAADSNVEPELYTAMQSILKNAAEDDILHFYILDNGISRQGKNNIQSLSHYHDFTIRYFEISTKRFENVRLNHITTTTFARFFIPELIQVDKILYLDCDTMTRTSLAELYNTDLADNYIAGVLDVGVSRMLDVFSKLFDGKLNMEEYVNAGVLLMNVKKWREDHLADKMMKLTAENDFLPCYDQDPINFLCQGRKKFLPACWNVKWYHYKQYLYSARSDYKQIIKERDNCCIWHFHPLYKNSLLPYRNEYLELLKEGPYAYLIPNDDPKIIALMKHMFRYWQADPLCVFKPDFYRKWKECGTIYMFDRTF